ncbi:ABC transporter permease [Actinokineospora pegani]|uniref:ABC transporter permease n=1 Tax=Actinokineospora pegani TaxID=2654637 RepID=UPI0012EA2088|nr:ABC transporter permease [Actinokineospora pegani]
MSESTTGAIRLVAEREIRTFLRVKGFWIGLGVIIVGLFAISVLPSLFGGDATRVAVVGVAAEAVPGTMDAVEAPSVEAAEELVRSEEVEAAVVPDGGGLRVIALTNPPTDVLGALTTAPPVDLLEPADIGSGQRQLVVTVFGVVFLMFGMGGMAIAQSTVTEKQTRVVEILVSAVPVRALLAGKVVGHTLLTLGQVVVLALLTPVALKLGGQDELLTLIAPALGWYVPFLVLGFVLLSALWAVAGSLVSRQEDLGSTTGAIVTLVMVPYFLVTFFNDNPAVMTLLSYVPFSAGVAMPVRMFAGEAAVWEAVLSLGIVAATSVAFLALANRLYAGSLLQTGGKMGLKAAWSNPD